MSDRILQERLQTLLRNLERIQNQQGWVQDLTKLLSDRGSISAWGDFTKTLYGRIQKQIGVAEEILSAFDRPDEGEARRQEADWIHQAWADYYEAVVESRQIFHETLEFLCGLVVRDDLIPGKQKAVDEGEPPETLSIHQIADEHIRRVAEVLSAETLPINRAIIPAPKQEVYSNLGRYIRLRFPAWTVWHLPLLGHDYGALLPNLALNEPRLAEYRSSRLFADAFATYALGPAYPFSLLFLELKPYAANAAGGAIANANGNGNGNGDSPEGEHVDFARAMVVLNMLEQMNELENQNARNRNPSNPYNDVLMYLRDDWNAAVENANKFEDAGERVGGLPQARVSQLSDLVADVWDILGQFRDLRYSASLENMGWKSAMKISEFWDHQLENKEPLSVPPILTSELRDAFNAGWLCRQAHKQDAARIEAVVLQTCNTLIS